VSKSYLRTKTHPVLLTFIVATGLAGSVHAAELSLDQALAMARKANRSLVAERARLAQAQTSLETAWAALFPTVVAQGRYTRNNITFAFPVSSGGGAAGPPDMLTIQPKNQLDGLVSFTAPLVAPPALAALRAVRASVDAAEASFESSMNAVLFAVAQAYYAAGISDELLAARRSSIAVAEATVKNSETRFASGAVTKVDVDRAQMALVRAEQAAREAAFGHEQAYRALATLIQAEGELTVAAPAAPGAGPESYDVDAALKLRPEFRAIELAAKSQVAQERAHAWRWSPTLSAFGNARAFNYDNFARQHHAWAVGAQLDWVLWDGGSRDAQRHLADAQARESWARAEVLRDSIRDDLANGKSLLETKRRAQQAAERQVALAEETLDLVRIQYEAGNVAQIDLLQAQDGLTTAKEMLAQAHYEVAVTELGLRRAAGTFPGAVGK
jgi:outer membrane protein